MPAPDVYTLGYNHSRKSFTLDQLLNFNIGGRLNDEYLDTGLTLRDAYQQVAWFKRCVDVRARSLAALPWAIYGRSDDPILTESEDIPDQLAWFDAGPSFFKWEVALTMTGAAYALIEKVGRRPTSLYHYSPYTITPKYNDQGVAYYERRVNGRLVAQIAPEDMLAISAPDAFVEVGPGAADANAALLHAQVLHDLAGYTGENLRSGLVKRLLFFAEGRKPNEDEVERTEAFLQRFVMGRGKTRPKILQRSITPEVIGSDLSDLDDSSISESHQRAIATGLGVPHSLVMSDAANFATAKADQLNFITTTLAHEARVIESALNRQIFDMLGLQFRFEIERTEAVQSAEQEKALGVVALYTGGVLTRDEVRQTLGYDPLGEETQAEPPVDEGADQESTRSLDLQRWRRKIERRGREVRFAPDHLSAHEADVIRERLLAGQPLDEVFREPFSDF